MIFPPNRVSIPTLQEPGGQLRQVPVGHSRSERSLDPQRIRAVPVILGIRSSARPALDHLHPYLEILAGAGTLFFRWKDPLSDGESRRRLVVMAEPRPTFPLSPRMDLWFGLRGIATHEVQLSRNTYALDGVQVRTGISFIPR